MKTATLSVFILLAQTAFLEASEALILVADTEFELNDGSRLVVPAGRYEFTGFSDERMVYRVPYKGKELAFPVDKAVPELPKYTQRTMKEYQIGALDYLI